MRFYFEEENSTGEENNVEVPESTSEGSESDSEYNSETVVPDSSCTYVYDSNLNLVCVEEIVSNSMEGASDQEGEETDTENIQEEESAETEINYQEQIYSEIVGLREDLNLFFDDFADYSMSVSDFIGLFVVLYLISIVLSALNSWRRSNR